jgi:hypothetical protein
LLPVTLAHSLSNVALIGFDNMSMVTIQLKNSDWGIFAENPSCPYGIKGES